MKVPSTEQLEGDRKAAFENWLKRTETKFAMSLVPPTDNDALRTLVESAFEAGNAHGMVSILIPLLKRQAE